MTWSRFNEGTVCKSLGRYKNPRGSNDQHLHNWEAHPVRAVTLGCTRRACLRTTSWVEVGGTNALSSLLISPADASKDGTQLEASSSAPGPSAEWRGAEGGPGRAERRNPPWQGMVSSPRIKEWCLLCGSQNYRCFCLSYKFRVHLFYLCVFSIWPSMHAIRRHHNQILMNLQS